MKIGYARVSTEDQCLLSQQDVLRNAGCEQIFTDVASGMKAKRPGLDMMFRVLRAGDILVVWKLDRLGRNMKHLLETVHILEERNIMIKSLSETIDTTTSNGKLMFHLMGALAEFERDLISERTQIGLKSARARGRQGGRRPLLDQSKIKRMIELYDAKQTTITEICKIFKISKPCFYLYLRKNKKQ